MLGTPLRTLYEILRAHILDTTQGAVSQFDVSPFFEIRGGIVSPAGNEKRSITRDTLTRSVGIMNLRTSLQEFCWLLDIRCLTV